MRRTRDEAMPMPTGILPVPPPVDLKIGISAIGWRMSRAIAELSPEERMRAYRANDAARSARILRAMNEANARFWSERK